MKNGHGKDKMTGGLTERTKRLTDGKSGKETKMMGKRTSGEQSGGKTEEDSQQWRQNGQKTGQTIMGEGGEDLGHQV